MAIETSAGKKRAYRAEAPYAGTPGDDMLTGTPGDDTLDGDGGDDTLSGLGGMDMLSGGTGNDLLFGDDGDDQLFGNENDDVLIGGSGADRMTGGSGSDTYYVDAAADLTIESPDSGTDRVAASVTFALADADHVEILDAVNLTGTEPIDLSGSSYDNIITGNAGPNVIDGRAGSDTLKGADGDDLLYGMTGNDTLHGMGGNDDLHGGDGNDLLSGGTGTDTMWGGAGDDTYYVDHLDDLVHEAADEGFDRVAASVSYALLSGAEVERLDALDVIGTAAIDLTGSDFANAIHGNDGNNILSGEGGDDVLLGRGGNDILIGGGGGDSMSGGPGDDTYYVSGSADSVIETALQGEDRIAAAASFVLAAGSWVETIEAVNLTDTTAIDLTGNEISNTIVGNAGPNILNGGDNSDTLYGAGGDDILIGGGHQDVLVGGLGNDTYPIRATNQLIVEGVGEGFDRVVAFVDFVLNAGAEIELIETGLGGPFDALNLTGNEFSQTINGNQSGNVINGGGGDDIMSGFAGNDRYIVDSAGDVVIEAPGGGADAIAAAISYTLPAGLEIESLQAGTLTATTALDLTGNELANGLLGNNGANVLDGGGGNDSLAGFGGADTFAFTTTLGAGNVDAILDFVSGTDRIALDDAVFTGLAPGALAASAFAIGSAAGDADDRIIYNSATGALYFDADGSGAGAMVQFAALASALAITASDFIVI